MKRQTRGCAVLLGSFVFAMAASLAAQSSRLPLSSPSVVGDIGGRRRLATLNNQLASKLVYTLRF